MSVQHEGLVLAGKVTDLFSHMALWGLARICVDMGAEGVRCWWTDESQPRAMLSVPSGGGLNIAKMVKQHAEVRAATGSWLHEKFAITPDKPEAAVALLAPRTAVPTSQESWYRLEEASLAARDGLPADIDAELLLGLGYRSWWAIERNGSIRADKGCSYWEMRTRNKGTDFVLDRLLPLASDVAKWPEEKIWAGLSGDAVDDSVGSNKVDSRTSTGFRLPGPVDSARAWCALWALSLFPVVPDSEKGSTSPAYAPLAWGGGAHHLLLMPVLTSPTSVERLTMLARSRMLVDAADAWRSSSKGSDEEERLLAKQSARMRLGSRGVMGIMQFPVRVVGSASAPERQTLEGSFIRT